MTIEFTERERIIIALALVHYEAFVEEAAKEEGLSNYIINRHQQYAQEIHEVREKLHRRRYEDFYE